MQIKTANVLEVKMKTITLATFIMVIFTNCLLAVYTIPKRNDPTGNMSSQLGKSFSDAFTQSYNDVIRRQRDLEQYEKMLEIQYTAQMKAQKQLDQYKRKLHEYKHEKMIKIQDEKQMKVQIEIDRYLRELDKYDSRRF